MMDELKNFVGLTGRTFRIELIRESHLALLEKSYSPAISSYFPMRFATAREYHSEICVKATFGPVIMFAVIAQSSNEPVGCSCFLNVDPANRKLEIGGSWLGPEFQGSSTNAETKLLLLTYAFETLGCLRVELKTDLLNTRSQAAMEKLGLTKEGILRNHLLMPDGRRRHSVYYSVIAEEWPQVKKQIEARVANKA
jgi:RimJ/RimL family protein N-acetyltransferase